MSDANQEQPDFLFHCGDLTPLGQESQYQSLLTVTGDLAVPFYTTPGNHDIRLGGRERYIEHFGEVTYSFDLKSAHFSVFDTSEGDVDEATYTWLKNDLESSDAAWKIVFTHIPPFDPRPGMNHTLLNVTTSHRLMTLFESTNVTAVFSGHIHMYNSTVVNGVHYFITGGAGASLAASEDEGGIYHYVAAELTTSGLEVSVIPLGTPSLDRTHIVLRGNEEDITLSLDDLLALPQVSGFSSFENQYQTCRNYSDYEYLDAKTTYIKMTILHRKPPWNVSGKYYEPVMCWFFKSTYLIRIITTLNLIGRSPRWKEHHKNSSGYAYV